MSAGLRVVERTATCKRCGADDVAWVQSKRGKWYLAEVLHDSSSGELVAQVFKFHKCRTDEAGR